MTTANAIRSAMKRQMVATKKAAGDHAKPKKFGPKSLKKLKIRA